MNPRTARRTPARRMQLLNLSFELAVSLVPPTDRARTPGVRATARHPHSPTENGDRVLARMVRDELLAITHWGIREQLPMAFFKLSRSWRSTACSRRRRATSTSRA